MSTPTMTKSLNEPLKKRDLFYYRERNRHRAHSSLLSLFKRMAKSIGLKKSDIAARTRKDPAQVARIFSGQRNITLDTLSDLFLGMGYEVEYRAVPIGSKRAEPDIRWMNHNHLKDMRPPQHTQNGGLSLVVTNASR